METKIELDCELYFATSEISKSFPRKPSPHTCGIGVPRDLWGPFPLTTSEVVGKTMSCFAILTLLYR